ncbi:MAG: L,D-transpeptidase family protein [Rhodospirillales bacterium]|nr:L,D-transpeptidase family protein [Rhodospirillales bacterium]
MSKVSVRTFGILALLALVACAPTPRLVTEKPPEVEPRPAFADRVLILKSSRELRLMRDGTVLKSYPVALGFNPVGPKLRRGDGRTPEGLYVVDGRNEASRFHRSLHLSYPNAEDRARAAAAGVDPGSDILIHGMPSEYGRYDPVRFYYDWTDGCIAVGNLAIEEIWALVPDGTPVEIRP